LAPGLHFETTIVLRIFLMAGLFDFVAARSKRSATNATPTVPAERPRKTAPSLGLTCITNSWIVCLGLIFVYTSSKLPETEKFFHDLVQEIGIALLVAYIIIITIEYRSRRELNSFVEDFTYQTHSDFFQLIMGVQFPKKMFEFVKNHLMQERAYRVKTEVHFTIDEIDARAERQYGIATVTLRMTCKYLIQNLSNRPYDFPVIFFLEIMPGGTPIPEVWIEKIQLTGAQIRAADDALRDVPGLRRFEYAMHLDRGQSKEVVIKTNHRRLIADTMVWRSSHSCDGLSVTVSNPRALSVQLAPLHPEDFNYGDRNDVHQAARIDAPLFPSNGFMFWWTPKETEPVAGSRPVAGAGPTEDAKTSQPA
jgi:hypothetical protein